MVACAQHLRVLVVDDNSDTVETTELLLRLWGHDVAVARNGPSALSAAAEHKPDVVLLDLAMPGMDGFKVADAIRKIVVPCPHFIAVSGCGRPEDVARCLNEGFHCHCLKPVEPDRLQSMLRQLTAMQESRHAMVM